jgi:single-strand DNA-binding protein
MSKSVNSVTLLGNIGQPPESRKTKSGTALTMVSIATNERKKVPNSDKWEDHTEWHSVVFFGRLAEIAAQYLRKGSKLYVEGRLRTTSWEDDQQVKRWKTSIIAEELVLLDAHENRPPQPPEDALAADNYGYGTPSKPVPETVITDEDIPF